VADLRKSGLTDSTTRLQKFTDVPVHMIDPLLGFHAPGVEHAYIIPFPDPRGGWFDHVKLKVFSDEGVADIRGDRVEHRGERYRYNNGARKYLARRASPPRLFFPLATMTPALEDADALWVVEGEKKSLAVAQLGLPAVGIESAWGWHEKGARELLPDFAFITMKGRVVKLVPDSDVQTNPAIGRAMHQLGEALERHGARAQIVMLPLEVPTT
jgi:hypothetical protein